MLTQSCSVRKQSLIVSLSPPLSLEFWDTLGYHLRYKKNEPLKQWGFTPHPHTQLGKNCRFSGCGNELLKRKNFWRRENLTLIKHLLCAWHLVRCLVQVRLLWETGTRAISGRVLGSLFMRSVHRCRTQLLRVSLLSLGTHLEDGWQVEGFYQWLVSVFLHKLNGFNIAKYWQKELQVDAQGRARMAKGMCGECRFGRKEGEMRLRGGGAGV